MCGGGGGEHSNTYVDCEGPTDSSRSVSWVGWAVVLVAIGCFICFCATSLGFVGALVDFLTAAVVVFFRATDCCVCLSLFLTPACLLAGNTTLVTAYKRINKPLKHVNIL